VATCNAQYVGFFTNNASYFNGNNWSLFAFGQNPCTQIANFSVTIYDAPCVGDIDSSGTVDASDLTVLLSGWGLSGEQLLMDLNQDQFVDATDLTLLLGGWGDC